MNYERLNSRKQGHVELMLYYVLRTRSKFRPSLGFVWTSERPCAVYCRCADCHENTGQRGGCITKTAGEIIETRQVDWCDQKHTVERQTDTDRPSCVLRTVKSRARPKGWCIIKG